MTLFQGSLQRPGDVVITTWSYQSLGVQIAQCGIVAPSAGAWPAIGLVIFVPFWVPEPFLATKMFWGVGAAAGNIDAGIYNTDQTRVLSCGTTAAAGSSVLQSVDITDTTLARGTYYLAMVCDTVTTLTVSKSSAANSGIPQGLGLLQQASVTLPLSTGASPATFAKYTQAYIPLIGVQGYRAAGP